MRLNVPTKFTNNISNWLSSLNTSTYSFKTSPIIDNSLIKNVCIGDIHADPRGFFSALLISNLVDIKGNWIGGATRVILQGDVLDGVPRGTNNPTITQWDEILCLKIIFEIK